MDRRSAPRAAVALVALSAACFVSVTSEYLPVALLPELAATFNASESAIGLLVTGYAVVVAVSVVPLVAMTARFDRRTTVLVTVAAVAVSNLLLALAPTYAVAVMARVVSAVGHGIFWSMVAPMAARLFGPEHAGRATAVVFAGNSLAFLFGIPLTSWLGATIGWRPTVLAVAVAAALSVVAVHATTGSLPPEKHASRPGLAAIRSTATDRRLGAVNLVTVTAVAGHFTAYTYITVLISDYVRISGSATSTLLLAHGAAGLVGLIVIGRLVDTRARVTALVVTGGVSASMAALLAVGPGSPLSAGAVIVLWALPAGGMAVVLQAAVLRNAGSQPDLASAVYIVAFQIGIGSGAWLGGAFLDHGALPAVVATAAILHLLSALVVRRSQSFSTRATSHDRPTPHDHPSPRGAQ